MTDSPVKLDIEQLRKKHKDLEGKKIAAETNLKNAEDQLSRLKEEARQKWNTDDLAELKQKLEDMKADNENKRATYQQHVEQIEARLLEVEREYAESHLATK